MTLPPVVVGQVHTDAHNAERTAINALTSSPAGLPLPPSGTPAGTHPEVQSDTTVAWKFPSPPSPTYAPAAIHKFDGEISVYNAKASNTRRWRAGIGKAGRTDYGSVPAFHHALGLGDSILGGCTGIMADTSRRFDNKNTVMDFYRRKLSARTGIAQAGSGLVHLTDPNPDSRLGYSTSPAPTPNATSLSLPPGAWVEFTSDWAGNQMAFNYYQNWSTAGSGLSISVNGSVVKTIDGTLSSPASRWHYITFAATTTVGQKVRITNTHATSTIETNSISVQQSAGGILTHNQFVSGSHTTYWFPTSDSSGFCLTRPYSDPGLNGEWTPDVVFFGCGLYDTVSSIPPATVLANIQRGRARFPNSDFVLQCMPIPGAYNANPATYMPYLTAYYQAADALDCALVDVQDLFGGYAAMTTLGLTGDAVPTAHYLQPAYDMWADALVAIVA